MSGPLVALVMACGGAASSSSTDAQGDSAPATVPSALSCVSTPAPIDSVPLAEASGATWVSEASIEGWFVVSDAGHGGDAVWISPGGDEVQEVSLPLDEGAGDDFEGLSVTPEGHLVALTSGGYLRKWMFSQGEPVISLLAQPISDDPFWRCDDPEKANCDPDYEGLCLDPSPRSGSCAGFAVSKERGLLVCLVPSGASYVVDDERTITVGEPGQLSGCSYELESPHRLIAAGNDKADGRIWEVRSPRDLDRLEIRPLGVTGPDGQEAAAFGPDGLLLLIGDTQDPEETAAPTGAAQCQ